VFAEWHLAHEHQTGASRTVALVRPFRPTELDGVSYH
jgi:hypothetical protein